MAMLQGERRHKSLLPICHYRIPLCWGDPPVPGYAVFRTALCWWTSSKVPRKQLNTRVYMRSLHGTNMSCLMLPSDKDCGIKPQFCSRGLGGMPGAGKMAMLRMLPQRFCAVTQPIGIPVESAINKSSCWGCSDLCQKALRPPADLESGKHKDGIK